MNRENAIKRLEELKECSKEYIEFSVKDGDHEALEYALDILKGTAPENNSRAVKFELANTKTINQMRKENGLSPISDGDKLLYHKIIL